MNWNNNIRGFFRRAAARITATDRLEAKGALAGIGFAILFQCMEIPEFKGVEPLLCALFIAAGAVIAHTIDSSDRGFNNPFLEKDSGEQQLAPQPPTPRWELEGW
jgi:hypothetical protein